MFCYEDKVVFPVYLSDQCFNDCLDLLLISNHYVYIKDFNRLMFNKNKCKNKKLFCKSCLQCFSSEKVLEKHRGDCLLINGGQKVKLKKGLIDSLDKSVKNLGCDDFKYSSEVFSGEKLDLVQKKSVYPYEYFHSFGKFKEST